MRVVLLPEFGIENLVLGEAPEPSPAAGEVLLAVEASTINPADAGLVSGSLAARIPSGTTPPFTPGWDLAGRIIAVGDDVDESLVGKRAVGYSPWFTTGLGTQAEFVALPLANIATAPESLAATQLTTLGLNGLTAWRAIDELALRPGDSLAILGAAGGVGGFATELAVARGVRVIAVVSDKDRAYARELGASSVLARGSSVRDILPAGVDALLDTASVASAALADIRDGGRYVTVTTSPESVRGITVTRIGARPDARALETLVAMASAGSLHTPVTQTFAAKYVKAAYREFAAGSHSGRIVLTF